MKTRRPTSRWILFTLLTVLVVVLVPLLPSAYARFETVTILVGGIWALAFYIQKRDAEDARFLLELMREFSSRYDRLNDPLVSILAGGGELNETQRMVVIDYFNLCAEEWLFWEKGYIDRSVWEAWENGMRQYATDQRVAELWTTESTSNSYYGFKFPNVTR